MSGRVATDVHQLVRRVLVATTPLGGEEPSRGVGGRP